MNFSSSFVKIEIFDLDSEYVGRFKVEIGESMWREKILWICARTDLLQALDRLRSNSSSILAAS